MNVAPPAEILGHVLEGTDAELDVEDVDEEEDDDEEDVELDEGRRLLDVLLDSIEADVEGLLLEEVVRMRLLVVLLNSGLLEECGFVNLLGIGSKESLECRWIQCKVPLVLAGRRDWLECRMLYVMLDNVCDVDGVDVGVAIPAIVTIAYD